MSAFEHLRQPIAIGGLTVRNRLMMTTHGPRLGQRRYLRYLEERAKGGVGLMGFNLGPLGLMQFPFGPGRAYLPHAADLDAVPPHPLTAEGRAYYDGLIPAYREWAETVRGHGVKAIGQLYHAGAAQHSDNFQPTVAPSTVADEYERHNPHALTVTEIADLLEAYALCAKRTVEAGYDGVEIHGAHGYLLNQFLSPLLNRRDDSYGGSLENRMRFLLETVRAVKDAVGADFPVGLRITAPDGVAGGLTLDEIVEACRRAVAEGLAYVSVSGGTYAGLRHGANLPYVAPAYVPQGPNVPTAAAIRRAIDVPVMVAGRITDLEFAERIVANGEADIVGMVRALIADPHAIAKSFAGRGDQVAPCIGGNECHYGRPVACAVNAAAGREAEMEFAPAATPRRVLVIGGGPAGIECAIGAARRGHRVTLVDRGRELGGMLVSLAATSEQASFGRYLDYARGVLKTHCRSTCGWASRAGRNWCANWPPMWSSWRPAPTIAQVPGIGVVDAASALADPSILGDHVVVAGGLDDHLPPLITADFIARTGRKVTLLTEIVSPGYAVESASLYMLLKRLLDAGVAIRPMTAAGSLKSGTLSIRNSINNAEDTIANVDSLVIVDGRLPDQTLTAQLAASGAELHVIGDALSPRRMLHATLDGTRLGGQIA